jgi:acyl-[acyl carrier protein]--UDP-N-acetylglucosamine O-acyltransferase
MAARFFPAIHQATRIGSTIGPIVNAEVRNLATPLSLNAQRAELELVQTLNREKLRRDRFNPEVEGVIESYELAFKMQSQMPQVPRSCQGI